MTNQIVKPSKAELEEKGLADLKKQAAALNVAGAYKLNKAELIKAVLKAQRKASKPQPVAAPSTRAQRTSTKEAFVFNAEQKKIIKDKNMSKSEKFRALATAGAPTTAIAKQFSAPYSFVFGALQRKKVELQEVV